MGDTGRVSGTLARGRDAFGRRRWGEATAALQAAEAEASLGVDDLERLAVALYLVGDDAASTEAWGRAPRPSHDAAHVHPPAPRAVWRAVAAVTGELQRCEAPA